MHFAVVGLALGGEAEARFRLARAHQPRRGIAPDLGAVLEAVARPAADQQHVRQPRVEVDQEIAVRAVLILADLARSVSWRAAQGRKAAVAEGDDFVERGRGRAAVLGVGIDRGAVLRRGRT